MPYGRGCGFRWSSPSWPHVGLGRRGLPRCWAYGPYPREAASAPRFSGYTPLYRPATAPRFRWPVSPEEEKQILQEQVAVLKSQLEEITKRIEELEQKPEEKS